MDRRQLSVVVGLWLVVAALISSHCCAARGLESEHDFTSQQPLKMVSEDQPLILLGEAYYFVGDEFLDHAASDYLNPHNTARQAVQAGIPNLSWSNTLADHATNWARTRASAGCNLIHSGGPYGENIFWSSSGQSTQADAVNAWVSEKQWYNYNSNSCASGKVCGHYTQVVWRNTQRVGCGSIACPGGGRFFVCNYDPPGNWIGQNPY